MLSLDEVNARLSCYMSKKRVVAGRYSLRDLSKEIGYSIQQISDVRRGRRSLKSDFAHRVKVLTDLRPEDHQALTVDQIEATQDIVHYHIMSLSKLARQRADPAWIAARLGIDLERARGCFERLLRLGLLRIEGLRFEQTHAHFTTGVHATTELMGKRYEQHSRTAFRAFYEEPREAREFRARTFAIPNDRLDDAKRIVQRCLLELDQLETAASDRVYSCFVQLFPVSTSEVPLEP